jgi:DNA-binding transcriptional ArsR family regulator
MYYLHIIAELNNILRGFEEENRLMTTRENGAALTQTVERALSILTCFSDSQPRLRVSDIARELELSQSTVSRLLATMETLGFVERDAQTSLYELGLELVTLAGVALNQIEVRRQAMAELSTVAAELGGEPGGAARRRNLLSSYGRGAKGAQTPHHDRQA